VRHNRHSANDEVFDPGVIQRPDNRFNAADFHGSKYKAEIKK